jgi:hypothetical protein
MLKVVFVVFRLRRCLSARPLRIATTFSLGVIFAVCYLTQFNYLFDNFSANNTLFRN